MMRKWIATLCLLSGFGFQAMADCVPCSKAARDELFASGEWPLPVRIAPFPIQDVTGTWDLGDNRPLMMIEFLGTDIGGRHYVSIYIVDRTTNEILGGGQGRLINDILVSSVQVGEAIIYMELKSYYMGKSSEGIRSNERQVFIYLADDQNNQRTNFRVYKIQ